MLGTKGAIRLISLIMGLFPRIRIFPFWGKVEERISPVEVLFIKEFAPVFNTKDEYRSRTLTLKF